MSFAHVYVWIWLAIFAIPFLATLTYSLRTPEGAWTLSAYQYVLGSFRENLLLSFETTVMTIIINLLISIPAAYAIVRYPIPGKSFLLSTLNLSLYTPAAVMGVSLVIAFAFLFRIPQTDYRADCGLRRRDLSADAGADHRGPARSADGL